jgi:hypothetical protein
VCVCVEGSVDEGYWRVYVYSADGYLFNCGGKEEQGSESRKVK